MRLWRFRVFAGLQKWYEERIIGGVDALIAGLGEALDRDIIFRLVLELGFGCWRRLDSQSARCGSALASVNEGCDGHVDLAFIQHDCDVVLVIGTLGNRDRLRGLLKANSSKGSGEHDVLAASNRSSKV